MTAIDEVFELFERRGREAYFGESVSILEHSLQAAWLAEQAGAEPHLLVAALLHDVGHLLHQMPGDIAERGIDGRHEAIGEAWLRFRFGPDVSEPVRLHVEAKRYLCCVEPAYLANLSPSSIQSLELQGGPLSPEEARDFERNPRFQDAVALRRWDDAAKSPDLNLARKFLAGHRELTPSIVSALVQLAAQRS
jgi:[1-hydroxy-2-(trimethylamino)ethyl]phosphonate dioxygenase